MNSYPIGTKVQLQAIFRRTSDNGLVDPSQVVFILSPTNPLVPNSSGTYVYGVNVEVVRDSTGTYHMDYTPAAIEQVYKYKAYSLGDVISSCNDEEFFVR
jgi:hypothetical protein